VDNNLLIFGIFWPIFGGGFANFATVKKLSKNLSACSVFVLDAAFMQNLTFLSLLSSEISFGEKNSHPPRHPAYFAIHEELHLY